MVCLTLSKLPFFLCKVSSNIDTTPTGIGLATAKLLASRGAKLSLADVSEDALKSARKEIKEAVPNSDDVLTYKCDVREYKQVEDWIKQTVDHFGKLDGAANLAGTVGPRPYTYSIDEEDEEIWNFIIGVNTTVRCSNSQRWWNPFSILTRLRE